MDNISSRSDYSYTTPPKDLFQVFQEGWYNFVVNYNETYMTLTAGTYDFLCKLFCDMMKPTALRMAKEYAEQLERDNQSQKRQKQTTNTYNY